MEKLHSQLRRSIEDNFSLAGINFYSLVLRQTAKSEDFRVDKFQHMSYFNLNDNDTFVQKSVLNTLKKLIIKPYTMKKSLLFFTGALLIGSSALGQLSTRDNNDGNFRLGTRAQAGDAALHFVIPIVDLSAHDGSSAGLYLGNTLSSGDLLTFKYWHTNDLVIRGGFRFYADNSHANGTAVDSTDANPINEDFELELVESRSIMRDYSIAFGAEKHFSNSNIWDVYVGGEALIGLGKDKSVNNMTYFNGDIDNTTVTTSTKVFGFAGVVGFQVYVAELPLAIGLEYGWGGKWIFDGRTKVDRQLEIDAADISFTETWYQQDVDAQGNPDLNTLGLPRQYSDLSRRSFNMETNNSVRLTIAFLFSTRPKTAG
jgi:hypothetical protein